MGKFSNLNDGSLRSRKDSDEDMDPMSSLANLADCMLVLACGLMVALVVAWNIDISNVTEVTQAEDAQEISDIEVSENTPTAGGSSFIDLGSVYQDPETGKLYMVEKEDEDSSEDGGDTDASKGGND